MSTSIYRPNVAAVIQNGDGLILIAERSDHAGCWQFPQGGIQAGESPEEALIRELGEELSLTASDYRLGERRGPYRYLFPAGRTKQGYKGQEQFYFEVELLAAPASINIETPSPEFRAIRWIEPAQFRPDWLPEMKREVYRQVFFDFFGVALV